MYKLNKNNAIYNIAPHLELVSEDVGVGIVRCVRVCRQRLLMETMMNDHVDDDQRKVQDGDDHDLDDWLVCMQKM